MKKIIFLVFNILFILTLNFAQENEMFSYETFKNNQDESMMYRLLKPQNYKNLYHFEKVAYDKLSLGKGNNNKYPLLIFLHGAGERGNDNELQLMYIDEIVRSENFRENYPCFFIAPQCPKENRWVEVDWKLMQHDMPTSPSTYLNLVNQLVDSMLKKYPIDKERIYIMGLSMGGYGTWDYISRYTDKTAAAIPICGGADEKQAEKLIDIPIWAFHGVKDKAVPVERTRNIIKAIKNNGGNPIYTEYNDLGHLCWNRAFRTEGLFDWLFSQKK